VPPRNVVKNRKFGQKKLENLTKKSKIWSKFDRKLVQKKRKFGQKFGQKTFGRQFGQKTNI